MLFYNPWQDVQFSNKCYISRPQCHPPHGHHLSQYHIVFVGPDIAGLVDIAGPAGLADIVGPAGLADIVGPAGLADIVTVTSYVGPADIGIGVGDVLVEGCPDGRNHF